MNIFLFNWKALFSN
uniref:Uncharacterized protein n=1 Tax=Rhizophora mucronata TaxID=61149 RepID=A0A2P2NXV8_RHIMU